MKIFRLPITILTLISLVGCASIVSTNMYTMAIHSNPEGANVVIKNDDMDQVFVGTTPATVTLKSGDAYFHSQVYDITFSKHGYQEQHVEVKATISGWYWGNVLFGGIIGMLIVDPCTGKMWKLPPQVIGTLTKEVELSEKKKSLQIVSLEQIPVDQRKYLVQLN